MNWLVTAECDFSLARVSFYYKLSLPSPRVWYLHFIGSNYRDSTRFTRVCVRARIARYVTAPRARTTELLIYEACRDDTRRCLHNSENNKRLTHSRYTRAISNLTTGTYGSHESRYFKFHQSSAFFPPRWFALSLYFAPTSYRKRLLSEHLSIVRTLTELAVVAVTSFCYQILFLKDEGNYNFACLELVHVCTYVAHIIVIITAKITFSMLISRIPWKYHG